MEIMAIGLMSLIAGIVAFLTLYTCYRCNKSLNEETGDNWGELYG